ncbi:MAG: hypothetical protein AAB458_00950 [Patescibacteria group bacterium]
MLKSFLMKQMMRKQLAQVPERERALLLAAVDTNPDFFLNIAKEVQEKVKGGMDQQMAAMQVFSQHQDELRKMLGR